MNNIRKRITSGKEDLFKELRNEGVKNKYRWQKFFSCKKLFVKEKFVFF